MKKKKLAKLFISSPLDHDGHAICVMAMYPKLYRFSASIGWMVYTDGYWSTNRAEASLKRAVTKTLRHRIAAINAIDGLEPKVRRAMVGACAVASNRVISIMSLLKSMTGVDTLAEEMDTHLTLFNCKNGVIDLKSGELLPHSPDFLFTHRSEVDYSADAKCDVWDAFLDSLGMDDETLKYLQLTAGYTLTGLTDEEVMFYLYGATRTGKGTYTNALLGICGKHGQGTNFRTFTVSRNNDTQNFDLAILSKKRFISASESKRNERINAAVFKQVTGGDPVFAAFKGKDGFSFIPQWKVALSSNYPLNADPMDNAVWARVRVIKFNSSKLGKEDKSLKRKLSTDEAKQGILAWAVRGAMEWSLNGLGYPDKIANSTNKMRLEASSVLLFIDNCCSLRAGVRSDGKALYQAYIEWAQSEGWKPYGRKTFTQGLEQVGCTVSVSNEPGLPSVRYYTNMEYLGTGNGDQTITRRIESGILVTYT